MCQPTHSSLQYAVLHHWGIPSPHYDLLIESAPKAPLSTWQLSHWPITSATDARRLPDHRQIYLSYEGPVFNNRGQVRRIALGHCRILLQQGDLWRFELDGRPFELRRLDQDLWTITPG